MFVTFRAFYDILYANNVCSALFRVFVRNDSNASWGRPAFNGQLRVIRVKSVLQRFKRHPAGAALLLVGSDQTLRIRA